MTCPETVTVNDKAVNWLKEHYPALCIKAGLCERIGGRLYTKTYTTPPAAQPVAVPEGMKLVPVELTDAMVTAYDQAQYNDDIKIEARNVWALMVNAAPSSTGETNGHR